MTGKKDSFIYYHATPFPRKGLRRERLDTVRRGDEPMISNYTWLRQRRRAPGKEKANG